MKTEVGQNKQHESFGSSVGDGVGCFFVLLGVSVFFSFPAILALIATIVNCHK